MAQERLVPVCRYASRFFAEHGSPDWIELKDVQQGEARQVTVKVAESPVAGGPTKVSESNAYTFTVRPWTWTDTVWHYDDGRSVVYPAYDRIDWTNPPARAE